MDIKKRVLIYSGFVSVLEFTFFVYSVYWNFKWGWNESRASISFLLFFLASYQFSEVLICSFNKQQFGKIYGHLSLTFLPPLGLWLIRSSGVLTFGLEYIGILLGLYFSWVFLRDEEAVKIIACEKCFVRYQYDSGAVHYGQYYFGTIGVALFALILDVVGAIRDKIIFRFDDVPILILIGCLVFLVPTAVSVYVFKMDGSLVSSTMCKWASLFAFTLIILLIQSG
jgi:hypothetical protein